MKAFAAALLAVIASAETVTDELKKTTCNTFRATYPAETFECSGDACKAKDQNDTTSVGLEAAASEAWKVSYCEGAPNAESGAAANVAAFGALAAAAAALAF